jgi:uncharacterized protein YprB with RNaseH-like and TPR domain
MRPYVVAVKDHPFSALDRFYESGSTSPQPSRPSLRFSSLGGEEVDTPYGTTLRLTRRYGWEELPGAASADGIRAGGWQPGAVDARTPERVPLEGLVALDIETTGLSIGTGTVAFLVGVISADVSGMLLRQYLMRDFSEEAAQQHLLAADLDRFDAITTYNGARFDLPVLRARSILNRIDAPWLDRPHLDLLYPVRAVWRHTWPDCRLATAEMRLLGVVRHDDCEGWEVPLRYRQFLAEQVEAPLVGVLEHNASDLVSLMCLVAILQELFTAERSFGLSQAELLGLARAVAARGQEESGLRLYDEARKMGRLAPEYGRHMRHLTRILKRRNDWHLAREVWSELATSPSAFERFWAHLEEAKYQEHRLKTPADALIATEQARLALSLVRATSSQSRLSAELDHREHRLTRRQKPR